MVGIYFDAAIKFMFASSYYHLGRVITGIKGFTKLLMDVETISTLTF